MESFSKSEFILQIWATHRLLLALIYIDTQINWPKKQTKVRLHYDPLALRWRLQDRLQMIGDIKWIAAGCRGFEVLSFWSSQAQRAQVNDNRSLILSSYFIHKRCIQQVSSSGHGLLAIHKWTCSLKREGECLKHFEQKDWYLHS